MRYIIDRKTNEHERYDGQNYDATKYRIVEADSEGWIPNTRDVCPLPEDCWHEIKIRDGDVYKDDHSALWDWRKDGRKNDITHYRPILAEKVQEPEPIPSPQYDPRSVSFNLLDRLKAAHEHAAQIPDLEAELREVLGSMGYDLVARSPFVEPEPAVETPQDMTDWRNWREGDVIEVVGAVASYGRRFYPVGAIRTVVTDNDGDFGVGDTAGDVLTFGRLGHKKFKPECFRFHSRPAKGEK